MTEYGIPLPPDELGMVWDDRANPWARVTQGSTNGAPGGMWREAREVGIPTTRTWLDLVHQFGPVTDYEPRCEAVITVEDQGHFRCLLAPNHAGHHKLPETCWSTPQG